MDPDRLAHAHVQHLGRAAAADRDRHVPVAVLVQDDVARPRVGERARGDRVEALAAELELDLRARRRCRPRSRARGSGSARRCRSCRRRARSRRSVPGRSPAAAGRAGRGRRARAAGRAPRAARRATRCAAAGAKRSRPWNVREIARARTPGSPARARRRSRPARRPGAAGRCPARRRAGRRASRSASARREPPTPGSTTARCTPTGMYGSVFASTSAPWSTCCAGIPCVMSMISVSGAIRLITPWQVPTKSSWSPKSVRKVMNTRGRLPPPTSPARSCVVGLGDAPRRRPRARRPSSAGRS